MSRRRVAGWCGAALIAVALGGCRLVDPWEDIDDPEMEWRAKAAAALGAIEDDEPERLDDAAALLERRWNHQGRGEPVPLVRFAIVEAFGALGTERAAPVLLQGLSDPDPLVRGAAGRAIGHLGLTQHRPALIARLGSDASAEVRAALATALAEIGDPEGDPDLSAVPALIDRLDDTAIVSVAAHSALQRLTLQPLERDPAAWRNWWRVWQAEAPKAAPADDGGRKKS